MAPEKKERHLPAGTGRRRAYTQHPQEKKETKWGEGRWCPLAKVRHRESIKVVATSQ